MAGFHTVFADFEDPQIHSNQAYEFIKLPTEPADMYTPSQAARRARDGILSRKFEELCRRVPADVVHVCWIDDRAALCARASMQPLVLSCWGGDVDCWVEPDDAPHWRACVVEALSSAALTIVDTPVMAEHCESLVGKSIRCEMLHLGVDTERFRSGLAYERDVLRAKLGLRDDDVLLSSMRAMSPFYNHELILESFAGSLPKLRKPAYLLFKAYNSRGNYLEVLQRKAQDLGIAKRVRFVAEIPERELPSLYAATDIVINFPPRDGFPVTLLEAGACERRVISCALATYNGVVADDNVTWVPPNDSSALAAAMIQVTNECRSGRMSFPKVRDSIVDGFSEIRYQQRLATIYWNWIV